MQQPKKDRHNRKAASLFLTGRLCYNIASERHCDHKILAVNGRKRIFMKRGETMKNARFFKKAAALGTACVLSVSLLAGCGGAASSEATAPDRKSVV